MQILEYIFILSQITTYYPGEASQQGFFFFEKLTCILSSSCELRQYFRRLISKWKVVVSLKRRDAFYTSLSFTVNKDQ